MKYLTPLLNHFKNGTLISRLVNFKKHRRFRQYNAFIKSDKDFIEKKISEKLVLKLFKGANLSKELYCYGFEESEIIFFKRFLKKGDVVLDIGANIGLFTLVAAESVSPSGKVFSFEPSPQTFKWLSDNVTSNNLSHVTAKQMALSDQNGSIDFFVSADGFDAFNSIVKPQKGSNYLKQTVQTTTLDSFIRAENLSGKISLVKIDVEGYEIPLLSGASEFLSSEKAPDLIVEFTENNMRNAGHTCVELYDKIVSLGYRLYQYNARTNNLREEARGQDYNSYKNLIATKNPKKVDLRLKGRE